MAVKKFCICDKCGEIIQKPKNGVRIKGNVFVADPDIFGGIIGNNFPDKEDFNFNEIKENVYCISCLIEIIRG